MKVVSLRSIMDRVDCRDRLGGNDQSGLFLNLPNHCRRRMFAKFDSATGKRPLSFPAWQRPRNTTQQQTIRLRHQAIGCNAGMLGCQLVFSFSCISVSQIFGIETGSLSFSSFSPINSFPTGESSAADDLGRQRRSPRNRDGLSFMLLLRPCCTEPGRQILAEEDRTRHEIFRGSP